MLDYPPELLRHEDDDSAGDDPFPRVWTFGAPDLPDLPLAYAFEPGAQRDGVTVDVPLALLPRLRADDFLQQVPGRREELVVALLRSLPKDLRRPLVPVTDTARAVLPDLVEDSDRPFLDRLADVLRRRAGVALTAASFDESALPEHLRVSYRVVDAEGAELARGRDLDELRATLAPQVGSALTEAASGLERLGLKEFPADGVPREVRATLAGHDVVGHPALRPGADGAVDLVVLTTEAEADAAMRSGTRVLLLSSLRSPVAAAVGRLSLVDRLTLGRTPYPSVEATTADVVAAAADALVGDAGGPAWDATAFAALRDQVRAGLSDEVDRGLAAVVRVLATAAEVRGELDAASSPALAPVVRDVSSLLDRLVVPGFVGRVGTRGLPDVVRYLAAARSRLRKAPGDLARDQVKSAEIAAVAARVDEATGGRADDAAVAVRRMVDELRVSLFAQELRAAYPVSSTRILRALAALPPPPV